MKGARRSRTEPKQASSASGRRSVPAPNDLPVIEVRRLAGGAFTLSGEGAWSVELAPAAAGWTVEGEVQLQGCTLLRCADGSGGFELQRAEAGQPVELGRTTRDCGASAEAAVRHLLTADGRLFRIVLRGPRDPRFDVMGWDSPGAYLQARPERDGWRIEPSPAGRELGGLAEILVLLAAEILDTDRSVG